MMTPIAKDGDQIINLAAQLQSTLSILYERAAYATTAVDQTNNNPPKMDPGLNSLLQWGIENSEAGSTQDQPVREPKGLSSDALRALMGGPSDADLMKEAMSIIVSSDPEVTHESKMTAFDNFEQLVESIDNANNMEPLGLWTPMLSLLDSEVADIRRMAAWCLGTAVQNNVKAQERLLAINGINKLCQVALDDVDQKVRRKAVYALSSGIRNYQPAMNEAVKQLPKEIVGPDQVSAADMDVIDAIMGKLRDKE
ncbi:hsp70 nucleotide exchange factor fes1 [Exophiala xenobiotica]|nr:hsp70 nucleotide exchange factor fes1 [Exophiala xenobiotica]KAK5414917.1 hsp70 nucleotide exchange factor fes1 [Exophiala xenobiotica]KAK5419812.1 hsp70 nucleotide exchange factor fes1 [Exophiala xenobiotica]KAK5525500.1 hsp70 nucleotide exchange factor fes1 [Exophiala xenobiotica]